ncbi:phage minor tail protein L [uncultured Mediterranean phage uvMED]|jgi:phage-related protein|nr:phage minor tail protein L [uncultured Mediterranean phage uvMED]BAR24983.1 phage minor tail protein L [uncultured Mediterranean phage uvMED]BAR25023.1 phage minor tail protein L [uncultured Mediterranean phage uvMED]BAR25065.1 phage minor tail protein L [uncultured Mediterranean phage uvMED]BAR25135.1 phage minor tail protein L [uncultured Mediterranean phage uvMED]
MATFPSIAPTYGVQKRSAPNVRGIQFGSGYQQRAQFGINQNPKVYNLTFEVSEAEADTIETFLDARGAVESFTFTPPAESSSAKFICRQWSKSIPYLNRATITATFEQVFET